MKKLLILWLITFSSVLFAQLSDTDREKWMIFLKNEEKRHLKNYEKECNTNNFYSCFIAGNRYASEEGTFRDIFKAVELYQKACDNNVGSGCNSLGVMYEKGQGVRLDKSKAFSLFGKSCDLKNEDGCENYAKLKNVGVK